MKVIFTHRHALTHTHTYTNTHTFIHTHTHIIIIIITLFMESQSVVIEKTWHVRRRKKCWLGSYPQCTLNLTYITFCAENWWVEAVPARPWVDERLLTRVRHVTPSIWVAPQAGGKCAWKIPRKGDFTGTQGLNTGFLFCFGVVVFLCCMQVVRSLIVSFNFLFHEDNPEYKACLVS